MTQAPAIYTATILLDARDPDSLFFAWGSCEKEARHMLGEALAEAIEGVSFETGHAIAAQALVVQVPAQTVHSF